MSKSYQEILRQHVIEECYTEFSDCEVEHSVYQDGSINIRKNDSTLIIHIEGDCIKFQCIVGQMFDPLQFRIEGSAEIKDEEVMSYKCDEVISRLRSMLIG